MTEAGIVLVLIASVAAIVNGALGHGFSSITVPVALLFYTNRVLNPALVLVEVCINTYVLLMSRASLGAVWKRLVPIVLGLIPGIVLGALLLSTVNPEWLKLFVYTSLLPLILLQARVDEELRSEEHTSELQSHSDLVCRLLLEKKKKTQKPIHTRSSRHCRPSARTQRCRT